MDVTVIVVVVVLTALIFDFTNGFHDTANAMATSIATGALRPKVAVALAGCLNLAGAFLSVAVAKTISGVATRAKAADRVVAGVCQQAPRDRRDAPACDRQRNSRLVIGCGGVPSVGVRVRPGGRGAHESGPTEPSCREMLRLYDRQNTFPQFKRMMRRAST